MSIIKNIKQSLNLHIQKSYVEGIYSDNGLNRKLGRVGMSYKNSSDSEETEENITTSNPKTILEKAKDILSDRAFKLVNDLIKKEDFHQGDIYFTNNKIEFETTTEVNPKRDKDIINLGKREEISPNEESEYYKFVRNVWNPEQLERKYLNTFEQEKKWGTSKNLSMLVFLKDEEEQRQSLLDSIRYDIENKLYKEGKLDKDFNISNISSDEAEEYIKNYGRKIDKDRLAYYSRHKALIDDLKRIGIDFKAENIDKFKEQFKQYIINAQRNDFYQMVKGCSKDPYYTETLVRLRFAFKYNKMLAGQGWGEVVNKEGKIDIEKRDEVLELCKQIEYAVDDVLGNDKDLFIKNPNIDFIRFDKETEWGGASYNRNDKTITITSEYFQKVKKDRKEDKRANTLSREKFMVEGFIHEIGHSLDITKDIYESTPYKDFARHLGYDKNSQYTIFVNAIKESKENFANQDYYLAIEKDKKEELINKFRPLYETYFGKTNNFGDKRLSDIFISKYSAKSVCEGFAEYFSFYLGNKRKLDKEISEYKKNKEEYLSKADIGSWYKYSVYDGRWEANYFLERHKDSKEKTSNNNYYYKAVVEHNIEMFMDVQKIINLVKEKTK